VTQRTETIEVLLKYFDDVDEPEKGIFRSSVADPAYVDEILLWVQEKKEAGDSEDEDSISGVSSVNIGGSRRALYELGCYLIALSRFETKDMGYHDHFDEVASPPDESTCDLIIHSPVRFFEG
jgi:hypothetical protein